MFVVAITRWARPFSDELQALAPLMGLAPYDARIRLAGPLPLVFAQVPQADQARQLLGQLRERGHGAVACDLQYVPDSTTMLAPRDFELDHEGLRAGVPGQATAASMPFDEILALVQAMHVSVGQTVTTKVEKKFSAGTALMTSGLKRSKQVKSTSHSTAIDTEPSLYVIRRSGHEPWLMQQGRLRYQGLGEDMASTRHASFGKLVELLRTRAPQALFDDRLMSQKRKASDLQQQRSLQQTRKAKVEGSSVVHTNTSATDLAAHLIAIAHLQQQG